MTTKEEILTSTISILAREGYAATSMRKVAASVDREASIIYAHYQDKEALLRAVRFHIIKLLDEKQTHHTATTSETMMYETVRFQLENRLYITALLQYFMAMRQDFPEEDGGYVPQRAYEHMTRVIRQGVQEGRYATDAIYFDAKVMVHLINGFLMEYFDKDLSDKQIDTLSRQLSVRLERIVLAEGGVT